MNAPLCRSRRRWLGRGLTLLMVTASAMLSGATPASAHPTLLFTNPAANSAVADGSPTLTLVFNEMVTAGQDAVILFDGNGAVLPVGPMVTAQDGHFLTVQPVNVLSAGIYTVRWRVTGTDGDQVEQEFQFGIGAALTGTGSPDGGSISWLDAALRWLLFAGVAVAGGALVGERFTTSARTEKPALPALRSWVLPAGLIALAGVAGLALTQAWNLGSARGVWQGGSGRLLIVEGLGLMLTLVVAAGRWRVWASLPLLVVITAEGLRSHANLAAAGWGAILTGIHLAAAVVWVGALLHVTRAAWSWRNDGLAVRWVLAGYARLALWIFGGVVVTGLINALLLLSFRDLFTTTYGQVLVVKLGLVAGAASLALTARLALRRPGLLRRVRVVTRIEGAALVGVLAVSAVLVSSPPASSVQPAPPPPTGILVPLSTLAGQIGVSVAASEGQMVVRLTTPTRGNAYEPGPQQEYTLTGQLSTS